MPKNFSKQSSKHCLFILFRQKLLVAPLAQIFQILAQDLRNDAMIVIEEKAQKLGVLLSLPLILCFLPALLLLIFGPALLKVSTLQRIL